MNNGPPKDLAPLLAVAYNITAQGSPTAYKDRQANLLARGPSTYVGGIILSYYLIGPPGPTLLVYIYNPQSEYTGTRPHTP